MSQARVGKSVGILRLLFLGVLIAGLVVAAVKFVPFGQRNSFGKFDRFNLLLATRPVTLLSLNPRQNSAVVVRFPDDLYFPEVIHGYGQYLVSSIFAAGELDKRGGETLAGSVSEYLAVPVDGYLWSDREAFDLKGFFLDPRLFGGKRGISAWDLARFIWHWAILRPDRIKTFDLGKVAVPLVLADGSTAKVIEPAELDSFLGGVFLEDSLRGEGWRVEVINTTKVAGLGARAVRLMTNIGLSVVNVDSSEEIAGRCQIVADDKSKSSQTVKRIEGIHACLPAGRQGQSRAEVTVFLGADYAEKLVR